MSKQRVATGIILTLTLAAFGMPGFLGSSAVQEPDAQAGANTNPADRITCKPNGIAQKCSSGAECCSGCCGSCGAAIVSCVAASCCK